MKYFCSQGTPDVGSLRINSPPDCLSYPPAFIKAVFFVGSAHTRKPLKRLERNFIPGQTVYLNSKLSCPTANFSVKYNFTYNQNKHTFRSLRV